MNFIKSTYEDVDEILALYDVATAYQIEHGIMNWQGFERSMVQKTIDDGFQYQIVIDNEIACIFTLALNDPQIWDEKDVDPAVYIHRIATNPKFRGKHFVKHIVAWVKEYAIEHKKEYVRLDTLAGNEKLNNYYMSCGFNYLGVVKIKNATGLPAHYQDGSFSLFEIKIS